MGYSRGSNILGNSLGLMDYIRKPTEESRLAFSNIYCNNILVVSYVD